VIGQIPFHTALFHTVLLQTLLPQMSLLQIHIPDVGTLLEALGPWVLAGIAVIVFIESGVLFPFLPGDSLLVTAAILAPQLHVSRWLIWAVAFVAAVAGDQVGYWLGRRFGRRLFKPDARVLKTEYLNRAEEFFDHYGSLSLVLGRFVPIVRTYVPLSAGIAAMRYRHFLIWNVLGGLSWTVLMVLLGTLFGNIPIVANHIDVVMIIVVLVSVLPIVIAGLNKRRHKKPADEDAIDDAE
jgi:membrane-associated protein